MAEININVNVVETAAINLNAYSNDINEQVKAMKIVMQIVESAWSSKYTDDFLSCIQEVINQMNLEAGNIHDIAVNLKSTAQDVRNVEKEIQINLL
ncbi:MAG: WXG100 family type VII secretion target [Oscillospiraceae bacterium]|nr:WXG100 family type VII secretion target [Oscillospiraceae bacterium]